MSNITVHINKLIGEAGYKKFTATRFGVTICNPYLDYDLALDLKELYLRSKEREEDCNICYESYCCQEMLKEKIISL